MFIQRILGVNLKTDPDTLIDSRCASLWHTARELHFVAERGNSVTMRTIWTVGVGMLVAALFASQAGAQQCTVKPASISLGQTVRLHCDAEVSTATLMLRPNGLVQDHIERLDGSLADHAVHRTVRLFKQASGG